MLTFPTIKDISFLIAQKLILYSLTCVTNGYFLMICVFLLFSLLALFVPCGFNLNITGGLHEQNNESHNFFPLIANPFKSEAGELFWNQKLNTGRQ